MNYYCVIDTENTVKCPITNNKAHFAWPANKIVAIGWKWGGPVAVEYMAVAHINDGDYREMVDQLTLNLQQKDTEFLVGSNIKHDLLYMRKEGLLKSFGDIKIWDIQLAEYLLTGQQSKYASLDEMSEKYGGTQKDPFLKTFWDTGGQTELLDRGRLCSYLKEDVQNTEKIFLQQIVEAETKGMMPLIVSQMEALLATTEMTWNGVFVDTDYTQKRIKDETEQIDIAIAMLDSYVDSLWPKHKVDWDSHKQISELFFGGERKVEETIVAGTYKNGKPKHKKHIVKKPIVETFLLNPDDLGAEKTKMGYYKTDDTVLRNIFLRFTGPMSAVASVILDYRKHKKLCDTYFTNILNHTFPGTKRVHPNLVHVGTATGRLSSNDPNMQNQTDEGGIKKMFCSRYVDGKMIEADYKQLEMYGLQIQSCDEQLFDDLNNGVDMHTELFVKIYRRSPTPSERKDFKRRSFALIYGAGPKRIAEEACITLTEAKKFIKHFYDRYRGVAEWHAELVHDANKRSEPTVLRDAEHGLPIRHYTQVDSLTKRRYVYRTYYNDWQRSMSFSPTELKNYPVQGLSTGDIMPLMLGRIFRRFVTDPELSSSKLVLTVHDAVAVDCPTSAVEYTSKALKEEMENARAAIEQTFGRDIGMNIPVSLTVDDTL